MIVRLATHADRLPKSSQRRSCLLAEPKDTAKSLDEAISVQPLVNSRGAGLAYDFFRFLRRPRKRWPDRPHWERWRWAIKALADACGATAHCTPKYHYMRVDVRQARSDALTVALDDIGCLIELASDRG